MLVDLGRNDVGRVAEYGTRAAHRRDEGRALLARDAHHLERDRPAPAGQTAFDALRAGLPAGTVSGAPKVRAMQIIDEVEPHKRGPYGGAVGYIDFTGNMDTCIALRTLVIQGKTAYIQAGGGVVYDSDPGRRVRGDGQQGPGAAQGDRDRRVSARRRARGEGRRMSGEGRGSADRGSRHSGRPTATPRPAPRDRAGRPSSARHGPSSRPPGRRAWSSTGAPSRPPG